MFVAARSCRTITPVVLSSRADPDDDVVDVTSFSALDVVEINKITPVVVVAVGAGRG